MSPLQQLLSRVLLFWAVLHCCRFVYNRITIATQQRTPHEQQRKEDEEEEEEEENEEEERDEQRILIENPSSNLSNSNVATAPPMSNTTADLVSTVVEESSSMGLVQRKPRSYGCEIGWIQAALHTSIFNPCLKHFGESHAPLLRVWFGLGAVYGIVVMVVSVLLCSYSLLVTGYHLLHPLSSSSIADNNNNNYNNNSSLPPSPSSSSSGGAAFTALIPGVNLPTSHVLYYFLAILLNAILHEIGHALAAIVAGVPVRKFGVFLAFIYPGAFVELRADSLAKTSTRRQLWIYCAGVWHNVVIALLAVVVLTALPVCLFPLYEHRVAVGGGGGGDEYIGAGVGVVEVAGGHALAGSLHGGGVITGINNGAAAGEGQMDNREAGMGGGRRGGADDGACRIETFMDWRMCLEHLRVQEARGYCVPLERAKRGRLGERWVRGKKRKDKRDAPVGQKDEGSVRERRGERSDDDESDWQYDYMVDASLFYGDQAGDADDRKDTYHTRSRRGLNDEESIEMIRNTRAETEIAPSPNDNPGKVTESGSASLKIAVSEDYESVTLGDEPVDYVGLMAGCEELMKEQMKLQRQQEELQKESDKEGDANENAGSEEDKNATKRESSPSPRIESVIPFVYEEGASERRKAFTCMPVRRTILSQDPSSPPPRRCRSSEYCRRGVGGIGEETCVKVVYSFPRERLFSLQVLYPRDDASKASFGSGADEPSDGSRWNLKNVLFIGDPLELLYKVTVTEYTPRLRFLGNHFPVRFATFLRYLITLSLALSVLNILPAYQMDGHQALRCVVRYYLRDDVKTAKVTRWMVGGCTVLLAMLVLASMALEVRRGVL
eukprot:Nk52_evm79s164 gene=Nk52_evmTU79s164